MASIVKLLATKFAALAANATAVISRYRNDRPHG
jgi:hypothetical protein